MLRMEGNVMIIDMHSSMIPEDPEILEIRRGSRFLSADPAETMPEPFLQRMDSNGIDRSVVWWNGKSSDECRRNNDFIAEMAATYPGRLIPFATLYPPDIQEARAEAVRAINELGMAGIKLHPNVLGVNISHPGFLAVVETARELGVPFVSHVDFTRPAQLPNLEGIDDREVSAPSNPPYSAAEQMIAVKEIWDSPRVQSAHMGGLHLDVIRNSSLTFQTTGAAPEVIEWAVINLGAERVVFGSDFPFFLVEDELDKVQSLAISKAGKEAIFSGNALARVLPEAWT